MQVWGEGIASRRFYNTLTYTFPSECTQCVPKCPHRSIFTEAISVVQKLQPQGLTVKGWVHDERALEYCRFIRIDGLGTRANPYFKC